MITFKEKIKTSLINIYKINKLKNAGKLSIKYVRNNFTKDNNIILLSVL